MGDPPAFLGGSGAVKALPTLAAFERRRGGVALRALHDHLPEIDGAVDRSFARDSTASSIGRVSLPVNVFCWLG